MTDEDLAEDEEEADVTAMGDFVDEDAEPEEEPAAEVEGEEEEERGRAARRRRGRRGRGRRANLMMRISRRSPMVSKSNVQSHVEMDNDFGL